MSLAERGEQNRPSVAEARAIAEEGFVYGLPIVMNYAVMHSFVLDKTSKEYKGPFNTVANEARVFTYKDTTIVTPNSDTPYSMLWLDLRAEPMVISVPKVDPKRYYSLMLNDGNTFNYGYVGSRATGSDAGDYLIVGPRWQGETPRGIKKVFQSTTDFSLAVFRTQLFDAKDMPNVKKVQAGYRARPLSAYLKSPAPPAPAAVAFPKIDDELAWHFRQADVFVFPSRTDTFGLVMLEAMASGTPVAAFPVTGPVDVVRHGVSGVLDADLRRAALVALDLPRDDVAAHARESSWARCTAQFVANLHPAHA